MFALGRVDAERRTSKSTAAQGCSVPAAVLKSRTPRRAAIDPSQSIAAREADSRWACGSQASRMSDQTALNAHCRPRHRARLSRGRVSDGKHAKPAPRRRRGLRQAGPTTASGISLAHRIVSRSGRISDIPMTPPTSMMTPQIMKPVLKPSSGVAAVSTTLPMT